MAVPTGCWSSLIHHLHPFAVAEKVCLSRFKPKNVNSKNKDISTFAFQDPQKHEKCELFLHFVVLNPHFLVGIQLNLPIIGTYHQRSDGPLCGISFQEPTFVTGHHLISCSFTPGVLRIYGGWMGLNVFQGLMKPNVILSILRFKAGHAWWVATVLVLGGTAFSKADICCVSLQNGMMCFCFSQRVFVQSLSR